MNRPARLVSLAVALLVLLVILALWPEPAAGAFLGTIATGALG